MNKVVSEGILASAKKHKKSGFIIVLLCVLACEIPVLIALLSFGGLSTAASLMSVPPMLQSISLTIGIIGLLAISAYLAYRVYAKVTA